MMRSFTAVFLVLLLSIYTYSQSVEELIKQGDQLVQTFDHQKALDIYFQADKISPANWEILWRISRAYVDIGTRMLSNTDKEKDAQLANYEKAFFYADSSVRLAPDQSITYVRRAIANGRIALFEGVFSVIGTVNDVKDDCERAIQLGNGGNYFQALAHYVLSRTNAKVCEKPYLIRLPLGLGWGDMDDAIREYQTAIKLKPNYRMFHLDLAKAFIEEDEYELAKENLLKVEQAPFVLEQDNEYLDEAKKLLVEVNKELE